MSAFDDIELQLGPKTFFLRFTFKSFQRFQSLTGLTIMGGLSTEILKDSLRLPQLLWVAILANHPDYDAPISGVDKPSKAAQQRFEQLGALIEEHGYIVVMEAIASAYLRSVERENAKKVEAEEGKEPGASGASSSSGQQRGNNSESQTESSGD